jgi:DNA-binding transcriptional MerR regulator
MKTAGQLCKELGIRYYRLDYLIRNGHVSEPRKLDSGQRVFTEQEVKVIKDVLFNRMK